MSKEKTGTVPDVGSGTSMNGQPAGHVVKRMDIDELRGHFLADCAPALHILWAIKCEVQGHECEYHCVVNKAINGMEQFMARLGCGEQSD